MATEPIPLSRERVLQTALELADGSGVEALTMRRLGGARVRGDVPLPPVAASRTMLDGMLDLVSPKAAAERPRAIGGKRSGRARAR